jgi:hypothetical protein
VGRAAGLRERVRRRSARLGMSSGIVKMSVVVLRSCADGERSCADGGSKSKGKNGRASRARSRFLAALGMTARKARARVTTNAGVLRCAQDDGEEQRQGP